MIETLNQPHWGMLILAWFLADIGMPLLIRISPRLGAVDKPHTYKTHGQPVSFLGGLGITLAFGVAVFSLLRFDGFEPNRPLFMLLAGAGIALAFGLWDDFRPIGAVLKLLMLVAVTAILESQGIRLTVFPEALHSAPGWVHAAAHGANTALTLLWLAGVTSAMNSVDNTDGAAAGLSAVAAFFMFLIAWRNYSDLGPLAKGMQRWVSLSMAATLGGCLGFLRYNWNGARIFLGNNGAFVLGYLLAGTAVLGNWSTNAVRAFLIPCCLLVVPLFDLTLATVLRIRHGVVRSWMGAVVYCGKDHLAHRLMALGFSKPGAVGVMLLLGTVGGMLAYLLSRPWLGQTEAMIWVGAGLALLAVGGAVLDRAPVYGPSSSAESAPARSA